ncbi:LacI family DNA-binding transcriptional regulator [Rubellimicrobium roseum]|uniref:LacI family DNA-binding transcriptional regulator n=1 Tax=Rubellimicrobium roseum TaxID=687525 RepID=A0A5C4NAN8_9RHOB|nr:LacI family DNA-binding transcriptional regulator [Rubellimicrobium roseum]TNC65028.1 LacI family DNA-binding transcriptional regulator [Rubellimicrobium roseum]
MSSKPTMSDIALACGVSQATVSLVLNDAPGTRISAATRAAVIAKARELGYHRGARAVERRPLVAMLINEVTSTPHVAGLIEGLSEAANEAGLLMMVMPTAGDPGLEAAALDHLRAVGVRGVIYARLVTQEVAPPERLADWPTVLLNCHAPRSPFPSVVPGDLAAGLTATLALADAGHRRIAFIGGEDSLESARERLKGYRRALAMRDLPADPQLVAKEGWRMSGGYAALRRIMGLADPPTAAFCFCDRTAAGVYDAARGMGLRIPEDLSVIGFDNESFAADLRPALTTMELPHADMARHAVEELHRMMTRPDSRSRHPQVKIDCPLVLRGSVAPPCGERPRAGAVAAGQG